MNKYELVDRIEQSMLDHGCCLLLLRGVEEIRARTLNDLDCYILRDQEAVITDQLRKIASENGLGYSHHTGDHYSKVIFGLESRPLLDVDLFTRVRRYWWDLVDHEFLRRECESSSGIVPISVAYEFVITFKKELLTYKRVRSKQRERLEHILASSSREDVARIESLSAMRLEKIEALLTARCSTAASILYNTVSMGKLLNVSDMSRWLVNRKYRRLSR